ncbi:MAG TPA: DNA polymerase IV [Ktedonobacterales bacterium]|nr:DNA polymerase IV [Ktedonobacterales bacterium]
MEIPEQGFRRVLHADLDCFFAAVEELDDPSLRGKPVIVGGDPDRRGVVSTANYVARRYGVASAMAAAQARRLCPQAIFLRPRFDRYRELSRRVMAILEDAVVALEQVSVDEAYGELPPGQPGCERAETIARRIKSRVYGETGLVISIGVGRNKSIAKLASDLSKPDGCLVVRPGQEETFLHPLPVGRLNGVGPHTRERLERLGLLTVGDLAARSLAELEAVLGKHGRWLWHLARGEDDRPVESEREPPKSISHENTYERDIADVERAAGHVRELALAVARRAASKSMIGRTITLKVKWSNFQILTRQQVLAAPTAEPEMLATAADRILREQISPLLGGEHAIRLLGVALSGLAPAHDAARTVWQVRAGHGMIQPSLWDVLAVERSIL